MSFYNQKTKCNKKQYLQFAFVQSTVKAKAKPLITQECERYEWQKSSKPLQRVSSM